MADAVLVESRLQDAYALVSSLDRVGKCPDLAVWYFFDEFDDWRLMIASSDLDLLVPKQMSLAFRSIGDAISASGVQSLSISDVKVVRNDDPLPKAIRMCIRTDRKDLVRAHFANNSVNGIFIKEMIVLRAA